MKKLKTIMTSKLAIICSLLVTFIVMANIFTSIVNAATPLTDANKQSACAGLSTTGATCGDTSGSSIDSIIKTVVNILSIIVGVAAVIMIIIGGFKYVTSQGDSNNISSAKNTILYAIIGLVIVFLAQIIVQFTIAKASQPKCAPGQVSSTAAPCTP